MVMSALLACNPHAMWLKQCTDERSVLGMCFEDESQSQYLPFCRLVLLTHQQYPFWPPLRTFLARSHGIACFHLQQFSVIIATIWSIADQALPYIYGSQGCDVWNL